MFQLDSRNKLSLLDSAPGSPAGDCEAATLLKHDAVADSGERARGEGNRKARTARHCTKRMAGLTLSGRIGKVLAGSSVAYRLAEFYLARLRRAASHTFLQ